MLYHYTRDLVRVVPVLVCLVLHVPLQALGQEGQPSPGVVKQVESPPGSMPLAAVLAEGNVEPSGSLVGRYADPAQGASSDDLVRRALTANAELAAVRLDIERARSRIRQAGLRQNPTIDFEQSTGRFTGSAGEREISIGFSLPLELNGQRQRRVALAEAELQAAEAEVADRERRLAAEVRVAYAEALAALRELEITEGLNSLDVQTARIVEARVNEGESAPLELNLLRAEADRLKSRRALVEGRLQATLLRLKALAGFSADERLLLRENLATPVSYQPPSSLETALDIALKTRPDVRLARLNEKVAEAGLELASAQARPDVSAFTKFTATRSSFDNTPVGPIRDNDKVLSFGLSVSIPLFNRNHGAKAEAATQIAQAKRRRESVEQLVRAEVASAFVRYQAAQSALAIFEQGVLARSSQNVKSMQGAYQLGAFRMTELLAEQRRLLDSQREYTEALTERYKALADLLSATGTPASASAK
jgi:outer membrane protein, heavy metal efflux system